MEPSTEPQKPDRGALILTAGLAFVKLLLHLYTNAFAGYGIFRDELYYIACSNRLGAGYVDQPPLSIYILKLNRLLFGDSLFALRLLPALAGALTVFLAGRIAQKIGGGKTAILIACLATIAAPILLGMNAFYSMNSFDILLWALAAYLIVSLIDNGSEKLWLLLGVVLGLGLLNKIGFLWLGAGIFMWLIVTPHRRHLKTRWPYMAALIALILFSPYIIWNLQNDFAHIEFVRNATSQKYSSVSPIDFIAGQFLIMSPLGVIIGITGLLYLLVSRNARKFNALSIIFITTFLILLLNRHSKPEYMGASYPMLFAGGAVLIEQLCRKKGWAWFKYVTAGLLIATGAFLAPFALPILPVDAYIRYATKIGFGIENAEGKETGDLHQFFADMFGWENMARTVSDIYRSLPEADREKCVLLAWNYGEAGAIEFYSSKYDLPPAISPHNSFWIWGPGETDGSVLMIFGGTKEGYAESFESIEEAGIIRCTYCMPYENNLPVFICRNLKKPLDEVWERIKNYN